MSSKPWAKLGTRPGMSLVPSHRSPFSDKSTSCRSHPQILLTDYVIIMVWASKFEVTLPRAPLKSKDNFGFEALPHNPHICQVSPFLEAPASTELHNGCDWRNRLQTTSKSFPEPLPDS